MVICTPCMLAPLLASGTSIFALLTKKYMIALYIIILIIIYIKFFKKNSCDKGKCDKK